MTTIRTEKDIYILTHTLYNSIKINIIFGGFLRKMERQKSLLILDTDIGDDIDMVLGVLIAFAMPTAGLASTFSDNFGGDTENAVAFTLGTTVLSIITIPLLYWAICLML